MNQFGSVRDILKTLRRRAALILLITAIGCAVSVYVVLQQPKLYETTAVVQIEQAQIVDARTGRTDAALKLQLMEQRMMARDNLIEIIEDYDLFADSDLSMALKVVRLRESAELTAITDAAQPWDPNANPTGLMIKVSMNDPQQAADVANELLARIVDQGQSRSARSARETLAFFDAEEQRLAADITDLEREMAEFKQVNADSLPEAVAAQRAQLSTLAQSDLEIERQLIEIQSNTRRARSGVEEQMALLEQQRAAVRARIAAADAAIASAPQVEQELSILDRRLTQLQEQYSVVTRRRAEAETANALLDQDQTERFEVLETALVPEYPVSRSRKKLAIAGGVFSLVVATGAAFLVEILNPVIRTSAQLERAVGMQAVVSIPNVMTARERRRRSLLYVLTLGGLLTALPLLIVALRERWDGFPFSVGARQKARL
ncbi:Wzz/FepE/Etk N-terminal domain-containing protein [Primorskyibacter sp. S187A]|uniref:Wzz/FepE/Etk N-terminal domain-containing protein n=1 Tax=Primorskyibacter sp. S187A TaxID=3415130 RepID=UPI003C7BF4FB